MTSSEQLYQRGLKALPGGVNSPVRAMRSIGRDPIFIASGYGSHIRDVDGNDYVDWVGSWGPLILGHAHPDVTKAVTESVRRGTTFGAPTEGEVRLAELIAERIPSVEMLRMTSSGTEATMSALRLARAVTGRDRILKFAGGYHGHVDGLLSEAGSGLATQGIPASPGVPAAAAAETVTVPFNDPEALDNALKEHRFAAAIVEPVPANMGVVPAAEGFFKQLQEGIHANGGLLIADEVITGFRVHFNGGQAYTGLEPDLTVMGKIIGGGLPAGAVGGSRELLERFAPAGDVYQAGTLSGNPLAVAAGLATLAKLEPDAYVRLEALTARLVEGFAKAPNLSVGSVPGLLTPFFRAQAPTRYAEAAECDQEAYGAFARALLARGVYPPASQFEAWFPSLAHTDADVDRTLAAVAEALEELA
ncbi:MAG: glutamate-1-semialdehyde 2,1-aminomutase [Solirubrobacterales bacterium]|nr:glutamate-1-semialdehyde 2,1-aminomutase [Solirubrobacterales bacterium]